MVMSPPGVKARIQSDRVGVHWSGLHLFVDLWNADNLDDLQVVEQAIVDATAACGATLLGVRAEKYGETGGISSVGLLAESHIAIHTWSEHRFAACDIFVCGNNDPYQVVPVLKRLFRPERIEVHEHKRLLTVARAEA